MPSTGGKMSHVDPAVLYWLDEQFKFAGVLACHVDDFLWADLLKSACLNVGCEEHEHFCYEGMDFATVDGVVQIHQHSCIDNL